MAARHLQRLRAAVNEKAEEEHASSEEEIVDAKPPFNPFDLLSDEEVVIHSFCTVGRDVRVGYQSLIPQASRSRYDKT